jgi:hypothetical protein
LRWDEEARLWCSRFAPTDELSEEIREVFERTGYGCLMAETNIGVIHVCHAADSDIEGFADKPVLYWWQLIRMAAAPLSGLRPAQERFSGPLLTSLIYDPCLGGDRIHVKV